MDEASIASQIQDRSHAAAHHVRARVGSAAASSYTSTRRRQRSLAGFRLRRPVLRTRTLSEVLHAIGHDRVVALVVVAIVVGASALSLGPTSTAEAGDIGGPTGAGDGSRIAVGGAPVGEGVVAAAYPDPSAEPAPNLSAAQEAETTDEAETAVEGPFLEDGTLLKPVAVDTTVADGSDLVKTYTVKSGDTLSGIAQKFDVSTMSVWWANDLKDKADLKLGQELRIPPVSGLIVEVRSTDTLESLAKRHDVAAAEIIELNGLEDPNLVVGQVLVVPGAKGKPIATPTPRPTPKPIANSGGGGGGGSSSGGGGGTSRPPKSYSGGSFAWPAPGGTISQYYHYGHYGLDIDGDSGDAIIAAAKGTVIFSGWKNNGGGYQVWIAHGSGLYTTYNHMSSVAVGNGQSVSRGQRVGRMGATGFATGSHLHFEVWKGPIWNGGKRVNPLGYL